MTSQEIKINEQVERMKKNWIDLHVQFLTDLQTPWINTPEEKSNKKA